MKKNLKEPKKGPKGHLRVGVALDKFNSCIDWQKLVPRIESVDLLQAHAGVLAGDIKAPADVPPFSKAAMDGYAVRSQDTTDAASIHPATLTVIGDLAAGGTAVYHIGAGEAISIATGARLPEGSDAVVMFEHAKEPK